VTQNVSQTPEILLGGLAALLLGTAGICDLATRTIPDRIPLALILLGVAAQLDAGRLGVALLVAFAVFGLAALAWRRGWMGGGDVKLLAACALFLPPARVPGMLLATALAGGVLAGIYLFLRRVVTSPPGARASRPPARRFLARALRAERWRIARRGSLPYANAIAAGALFVLIKG